jgi:hypothetical protein
VNSVRSGDQNADRNPSWAISVSHSQETALNESHENAEGIVSPFFHSRSERRGAFVRGASRRPRRRRSCPAGGRCPRSNTPQLLRVHKFLVWRELRAELTQENIPLDVFGCAIARA